MSWNSSAVVDPLLSVEKIATKPSEPSEDEFDLLAPLPKDYGMEQAPVKSLTDWSVGEGTTKDAQNRAPDRSWLSSRQAKIDPLLSVEKAATAKSLTDWSVGEGTTKDAQNRARGRAWPSSWLSRRQTNLLLFLGLVMAALFMYVHYLRESIDMLFDITEVDVGFDNGAIQANLTVSGQFLPGESAKVPAWVSILGLWEGGAVSLRRYARYATHSANF